MSYFKSVLLWYRSQKGVHFYFKFTMMFTRTRNVEKSSCQDREFPVIIRNKLNQTDNYNNNNNDDFISKALFHVKHAQLRCTVPMNNTHTDTMRK